MPFDTANNCLNRSSSKRSVGEASSLTVRLPASPTDVRRLTPAHANGPAFGVPGPNHFLGGGINQGKAAIPLGGGQQVAVGKPGRRRKRPRCPFAERFARRIDDFEFGGLADNDRDQ